MAKKKKTQLKPVVRGFATTSLPKKIIAESQPESSELPPDLVDDAKEQVSTSTEDPHSASLNTSSANEILNDAEALYQSFVDKLQEKTEKEISRTVKTIEVDRRFSQTLARLDIDPILRDKIVAAATDPANAPKFSKVNKLPDEQEEKLVARLGITYGVLRRLGFTEERVNQCLKAINGVDLEAAYEWLYLHCSDKELDPNSLDDQADTITRSSSTSEIRITVLENSGSKTTASTQVQKPSSSAPNPRPLDISPHIKSCVLTSYGSSSNPDNVALDEMDPTLLYVCLKLERDLLTLERDSSLPIDRLHQLNLKIMETSKDYLFDEKSALIIYRKEQETFKKSWLEERLRFEDTLKEVKPKEVKPKEPVKPPPTDPSTRTLFDESDSDDSSTGVLGYLDEIGATEVTVKGVTYKLQDMNIPKHWSGPMPKTLLRDYVTKRDKYAALSFAIISGNSRAKRASVTISWKGSKRDHWSMDDIACPSEHQAEQYISTIALHSLTFPLTDGFVSSSPANASNSTSFKLLPSCYRDLWDELEVGRKTRDDMINRTAWSNLHDIVTRKLQNDIKQDKSNRQGPAKQAFGNVRGDLDNNSQNLDSLSQAFRVRQASAAYQEMLAHRNTLPIAQYRSTITDILDRSQVLVLSGETGCGKSTQVPAFLLEDHLSRGKQCKIYCTEPRRISAISLAQRVSQELCDPLNSVGTANSLVGYSIRLESNITRNTRLAFVTNGIALRMLEGGSGPNGEGTAFDEITHLIIDEVHERTIESDFLLIVLKSLLLERPDLKVILMSATLDAEKISTYFNNCEILQVPGRTFPVNVQYLEDAIEYTNWFIKEDSPYARRLNDKYYMGKTRSKWTEDTPSVDDDEEEDGLSEVPSANLKLEKRYSLETARTLNTIDERLIPYDLIILLLENICYRRQEYCAYSQAILIFMPGLGEIRRLNDMLMEHTVFGSSEFKLYPLHSSLSSESQSAVFDVPPRGIRKIVIATNIAETGITIPDITCVIDTGKHREMRFDEKRQISRLSETFVARSNAAQRRGRAGRVQNGLCFHLFTKTRHDTMMADHPLPEMMRLSLSDLALRIKIMKVKLGTSIEHVLSQALDPPVAINVQRAVSMLVEVRALTPSEAITPMGRLLSKLPTDVHLGKFLLISTIFRCLDPALTIAATLNSKSPFITPLGLEQEADRAKNFFRTDNSDFLTIHNAFSSWRRASANPNFSRKFCRTNYLSYQNLQQIEELRQQLLGYLIDSSFIQVDQTFVRELSRVRYGRNRARFITVPPELDVNSSNPLLVHAALAAGLYPKIMSVDPKTSKLCTITNNQHAYFHPSSVNFGKNVSDFGVNHLVYFTLMHSKKLYAWETGPVDDLALLLLCGDCESKLISDTTIIDHKLKFALPAKSNVALKIVRERLADIFALQFQGKMLTEAQKMWMDIGILALSRVKLKDNKDAISLNIK